jgi:inhibitor of cysteine peptidase
MRALIVLVPLLVGASGPGERSHGPSRPPLSARQDSVIQARVGEEFTVTLQSNPTTGYRWMLADSLDPGMLRLASRTYVARQPVAVGSGGHERITFAPLAPGRTTVRLRYARHGQPSSPRTAAFRVVIGPAQ